VNWWLGGLAPISYSPQVIWISLWSSWEPGVSDFCCRGWNLTSSKFRSTNPFLQIKCVLLWLSWELVAVVYVMQGLELWCHYISLWDIYKSWLIEKLVINLSYLNLSFSPLQLPFHDAATHQQAILLFPRFVKGLSLTLLKNLLGISTGDVLIVVHWKPSTLTQYLMWFGKPPKSTGEELILLEIDREDVTTHMEEEDHSHCPWQPLLCLSSSLLFTLTHFAL